MSISFNCAEGGILAIGLGLLVGLLWILAMYKVEQLTSSSRRADDE